MSAPAVQKPTLTDMETAWLAFLKEWDAAAEAGEPTERIVFFCGLCCGFSRWLNTHTYRFVADKLEASGVDGLYPFGSTFNAHLNPARRQWVRDEIARLEGGE